MLNYKNTVLFALIAMNVIDQPAPEVKIEQGIVSGKISADGKVHEYMGIPYATVKGRFQAPIPPQPWDGVFKAVHEHYQCTQALGKFVIGTEDCLKVNVYVPANRGNKPLPVMFHIHGGAYIFGSGGKMLVGPKFLLRHDVILVSVNYRLGALGFLCLGIKEAPGNAGLKDQIAALRWVKKNIAAFGGDPDNITVFGHSAGATSTSLLVMSDATEGLFKRAIAQSGSGLVFWGSDDGVALASSLAKYMGHDTRDPYELYKIFANIPIRDLIMSTKGLPILDLGRYRLSPVPCVEAEFPDIEPVFTEAPYDVIKRNPKNMSMIYGITDREGLFLVDEETDEHLKTHNEELYNYLDFEFPSEDVAQSVAKQVKEFYLGDKEASIETRETLIQFYGDTYFTIPQILETELVVKRKAPIYNYYFKYSGNRNLIKQMYGKRNNESGASHGDELMYLFNGFLNPFRINARDQKMIDWMTKMWTNFAKYGDPTPPWDEDVPINWKPSTENKLNYLLIDENLEMGPLPIPERRNLWNNLYRLYRKQKL